MDSRSLSQVRIVLVEPAGPLNVGSVARIMKNMGLTQLVLVNPQCDPLSADARQMAVHAPEILTSARMVASLPEALQDCQKVVATAARPIDLPTDFETPERLIPWMLDTNSALVFGREDRGLSNDELNLAQRFLRIPSHPVYPSLNLAQSVAICCYELYRYIREPSHSREPAAPIPSNSSELASRDAIEGYYDRLESLLLDIGYLHPHTARRRMEKLRRLYNRAYPSSEEVAMLQGIVSQVKWAIANSGKEESQ
ncbi:RNA methyltransferase [Roseofilum casamattae]|uniref:tRNA (cytidine/uridine-2'-O-)-methyltransferase TrmJ n=1 Tax=Roseofilum casamattae BLCC-M143 TaxID=3022442 RepID=A0ABT7BY31_9CYAN|nr:RNA methyltransferase [Roseofilum casamattae]MDJ1184107.1 RNA methyltransferase [Roseofilum casamattae BLCC-M143]